MIEIDTLYRYWLIFLASSIFSLPLNGQVERQRANHWFFGHQQGLQFDIATDQVMLNPFNVQHTFESCHTMSDLDGELLFYTNGGGKADGSLEGFIWNRNHEVMSGGFLGADLGGGHSAAQGALSIPKPGTSDQYYLFTVDEAETLYLDSLNFPIGKGLSYFEIDMTADNGLGAVTISNQPLLSPCFEYLAATPHANCEDYWIVVTTGYGYIDDFSQPDSFYCYQVTPGGILPPVKSPIPVNTSPEEAIGGIHFSPDGQYFTYGGFLFEFDNDSGQVGTSTNLFNAAGLPARFPFIFSPNSRFLYQFQILDTSPPGWGIDISVRCYQVDLWSGNSLFLSTSLIDTIALPEFGSLIQPQLAPDGRLYLGAIYNQAPGPALFRVEQPNLLGSAAGFNGPIAFLEENNQAFRQFGNYSSHIFYYDSINTIPVDLGMDITVDCQDTFSYPLTAPPNMDAYLWSTGATSPTISAVEVDTYWVEVTKDCLNGRDTLIITAENTLFDIDLGPDTTLCGDDSLLLIPLPNLVAEFLWQDSSTFPIYDVETAGTYWVEGRVDDCVDRDTLNVDFIPLPEVDLGPDTVICLGDKIILSSGENEQFNYLWDDGSTLPTLSVSEQNIYTLSVSNTCGTVTDRIFVNPVSCEACTFYIPNAFTPNDDGNNDRFGIFSACHFAFFRLQIFNRWGAVVFEGRDPSALWDGGFKGREAAEGVYVYYLEFEYINARGEIKYATQQGDVTLIR